jgi:RNA polymerase sigma-70 factor (ECF subfamily)
VSNPVNHTPVDAESLAMLWVKAQPKVAGYISSLVFDFHHADDILQNVAAIVVRKRDEFDPSRPFDHWALSIAKLEILKHRRTRARDRHRFDPTLIDEITAAYQDEAPLLDERRRALADCVRHIAGRPREALALRYAQGLKPHEIARRLKISANAVSVMIHRTRQSLHECIERFLRREEPTT